MCGDACFYWMSSETSINNQHLECCHSVIILRCSCWFNWIDSGAGSYSFSGKQKERTYILTWTPICLFSFLFCCALIHSCHKTHHKGSNGAYDGYFQLPRPLLLCRNWRNKWLIFTTSKWKVNADGFLAVIRSFEGRSVIYPSFPFSFPLARKEDEEALKTTETDFNKRKFMFL